MSPLGVLRERLILVCLFTASRLRRLGCGRRLRLRALRRLGRCLEWSFPDPRFIVTHRRYVRERSGVPGTMKTLHDKKSQQRGAGFR